MVGADILAEIRLRAEEIRGRVHWAAIALPLATVLVLAISLMAWRVDLPDEAGPSLTAVLAGAAVWGTP
jgi:hypothetical protein